MFFQSIDIGNPVRVVSVAATARISSDGLRNAGQALVMHNSFDIPPAIKLILGWDVFFWSTSLEFSEGMMCVLQTKTWCRGTVGYSW